MVFTFAAALMLLKAGQAHAGLVITITGTGPTDTSPTITFSGSGVFGAPASSFLLFTVFNLSGGQYVDSAFNDQQINLTGSLNITVSDSGGSPKWSDTVDFLRLDNDGSDATPTGGELDIVFNSFNSVVAGDQYLFSGSAELNLSDSPLVDTDFSVFNNGIYSTSSTGVTLSASSATVFNSESVTVTVIPEPSSLMLVLGGVGLLAWMRQRRLHVSR